MKNDVTRKFITEAASATFTINEKRDFSIESIKFLSDTSTSSTKTVTITAKHDGVIVTYVTTFSYKSDYTFEQLAEMGFTKDSIITIAITQTTPLDRIKVYAGVAYIGDILDYVLDEAKEAITITAV